LNDERGKMINELDLTKDQTAQIEALIKEQALKNEKIKKKNIIAEEKRKKKKVIKKEYAKKLEGTLNNAQKEKFYRLQGNYSQYHQWLSYINSLP